MTVYCIVLKISEKFIYAVSAIGTLIQSVLFSLFSVQPTSPKFGKADSYEKLEKLGEGSYATVYKGKSK